MTLAEHLTELRRRLLVAVIAFLVAGVVAFLAYNQILAFLKGPYCHANHGHCELYVTSPLDGLSLRIKIAAFGGLVLASPVLLFELWRFITPGLKRKEKRYAIPFVIASVILFPVLLVSLQLARIVTPSRLLSWWRWAIISITVAAAVFTPSGDPLSMLALAVPLVAFYFLAIGVGKLAGR